MLAAPTRPTALMNNPTIPRPNETSGDRVDTPGRHDGASGDRPPASDREPESTTRDMGSHRGYDPETGLLARVRVWEDLLPGLGLRRVGRLAGSPPWVLMTWAVLLIAEFGLPRSSDSLPLRWTRWGLVVSLACVVAMPLMRQGAVLTAGRTIEPFTSTWRRRVVGNLPGALLIAAIVGAAFGMLIGLRWFVGLGGIVTEMLSVPFALPLAVVFGAGVVAVPLTLAALAVEDDSDALDCLSRGFESVLRGWLPLCWHGVFAVVMATAVGGLAWLIGRAGVWIGRWIDSDLVSEALWRFGVAVFVTFAVGAVGGLYTLVRRDIGGQEIEDL